jgi:hypothetical protein
MFPMKRDALASNDGDVVRKGVCSVVRCSTSSCHAESSIIKGFFETRFSEMGVG